MSMHDMVFGMLSQKISNECSICKRVAGSTRRSKNSSSKAFDLFVASPWSAVASNMFKKIELDIAAVDMPIQSHQKGLYPTDPHSKCNLQNPNH